MVYSTRLLKREDAVKLNQEATKEDYLITVSAGPAIVDAKSLLALFALIGKEITVIAPDHLEDPNDF